LPVDQPQRFAKQLCHLFGRPPDGLIDQDSYSDPVTANVITKLVLAGVDRLGETILALGRQPKNRTDLTDGVVRCLATRCRRPECVPDALRGDRTVVGEVADHQQSFRRQIDTQTLDDWLRAEKPNFDWLRRHDPLDDSRNRLTPRIGFQDLVGPIGLDLDHLGADGVLEKLTDDLGFTGRRQNRHEINTGRLKGALAWIEMDSLGDGKRAGRNDGQREFTSAAASLSF